MGAKFPSKKEAFGARLGRSPGSRRECLGRRQEADFPNVREESIVLKKAG